jgi:hypothetical protein
MAKLTAILKLLVANADENVSRDCLSALSRLEPITGTINAAHVTTALAVRFHLVNLGV